LTQSQDLEELLATDAWMGRIAKRMARDPEVADDLARGARMVYRSRPGTIASSVGSRGCGIDWITCS